MTKFEISSIKQRKAEDEALFVSGGLGDGGDDGGGSDGEGGGTVGDDASHSKLLTDIIKLNKNKRREAKRSVRTSSLGGAPSGVDTDRLLKRLQSTKLKHAIPRLTTLDIPVEKTIARKAKRAAGFEKVAIESEKWARLVDRRRKAEQVSFPLQRPDLRYSQVEKVEQQEWKPKTTLEEKVFGLLQGAKLVEQKVETKEEQAARQAMSLQELKERNRELWREREMRRRYEHKAMMHNKSKSRKHHRLLRRDKLKQQRAEMEELQRKDPEAALGVLQDLERARVEERMSLRHKKSKWAHLQGSRATRDKQAMAALKENQRMHRELTSKVNQPAREDDGDDDDDDDTIKKMEELLKERAVAIEAGTYDPMNPWTNSLDRSAGGGPAGGAGSAGGGAQEEDQSYTKFVKFWDEFNKRKAFDKKLDEEMERREEEEEMKEEQVEEEEEEDEDDNVDDEYEDIEEEEEEQEEVTKVEPKKKGNKKNNRSGVEETKATAKLKKGKGKKGKEKVIKKGKKEASKGKKTKKDKLVKNVVEEEKEPGEKTTKKKKLTKKQAQNLKITESDIAVKTKKKKAKTLDAASPKISPTQTNQQQKTNDPGTSPMQKSTKQKKTKSFEVTSTETPANTKLNKKSPKAKPVVKAVQAPQTEIAISIVDELFDEAEEGIKRTVKRKLEKLGITADQTWTKIERKKKRPLEKEKPVMIEEYDFTTTHNAENIDETLERNVQLEESEGADRNKDNGKGALQKAFVALKTGADEDNNNNNNKNNKIQDNKKAGKYVNVDPTKFIQVSTKKLVTSMPDTVVGGEEGLDDSDEEEEGGRPGGGGEEEEEDPEDVIREAFADDYLIDEFNSEKKKAISKDNPEPLSLALPGWGDWAGPNIKMSKSKMRRYRISAPKEVRKDSTIGNVIYNEAADVHDNLRSAMVSDLPYPFKSVKDFEASVRAPIGRMFVPETTHKKLTMPAVTTQLGAVIDPMTEDQLLQTRNAGTVKTKDQSDKQRAKRERQEREKEELSGKKSKSGGEVKRKRNRNRNKKK